MKHRGIREEPAQGMVHNPTVGGRFAPTVPRWFIYTLLTMLLWGGWGLASKPVSSALSAWEVQTLSTFGLLPVLVWLPCLPAFRAGMDRRRGFLVAFVSGAVGSLGNVACYQAMAAGGKAAAVIPLTSLYPLVTIALAWLFLRERLNRVQLAGVGLSLLALVVLNAADQAAGLSPWLAVALIPIALWGVAALLQKLATRHASTELVTFGFLLGFLPVAMVAPVFQTHHWAQPAATWLLVLLVGVFFSLGNLTLIAAYRDGRAAVVTPLASLYSLVTIPLAALILKERIGGREGLGMAAALLAILALSYEPPANPPADQPSA